MTQSKYYAVLTGDIIHSSRLRPTQLELVRSSLIGSVNKVRRWKRGLVNGKPEFFRAKSKRFLTRGSPCQPDKPSYFQARPWIG